MVENNKATLTKANAAVARGDNEGFLKFCSEDTKWTFVGDKVLQGKEVVREWIIIAYIQPPKFDIKNLIAENEFVTAIGNITMTDEEGKTAHYTYCDIWRFHEGKMAELTAFVIEEK